MISTSRMFAAVAITMLATACGGSAGPENPDPADDPQGTSEDELKARFTQLKSGPTDKNLSFLYKAGARFEHSYLGVYRYNKPTTEATSPDAREKRIKEVMHRYMCG